MGGAFRSGKKRAGEESSVPFRSRSALAPPRPLARSPDGECRRPTACRAAAVREADRAAQTGTAPQGQAAGPEGRGLDKQGLW